MPKGKAGPRPEIQEDPKPSGAAETAPEEPMPITELEREIIGEMQEPEVVTAGDTPAPEEHVEPCPDIYACEHEDCRFEGTFEEWTEHSSATGHADCDVSEPDDPEPEQSELFSEPQFVRRFLDTPVSESYLNALRSEFVEEFRRMQAVEDEKKAADAEFNARIKRHNTRLEELERSLRVRTQQTSVECEWRILTEENARGLFRLDTQECIERRPLSAEDRAAELERVQTENEKAAEATA